MKLKTVSLVLFSLILGIGCGQKTEKQPEAKPRPKPDTTPVGSRDAFHNNLQIYFVAGKDRAQGGKYVPLAEAMEKGIAQVNETGDVNSLTIENLSETETVFVNAGDIVKGGKQDRYLANTLVVPPKSGKLTLASFCVESGRWAQRGKEEVSKFSSSKFMAASVEQKLAAQFQKNQSEVWAQVASSRSMLLSAASGYPVDASTGLPLPQGGAGSVASIPASNPVVVAANITPTFTPGAGGGDFGSEVTISQLQALAQAGAQTAAHVTDLSLLPRGARPAGQPAADSTSLQLALENKKIQKLVKEYVDQMDRQLKTQKSPVGLAVAINGKVISADIYSQPALFQALWPKLINAAATEAVAKFDQKLKVQPLKPADFEAFLKNEKQESPKQTKLNDRTTLLTTKGDRHILFETHDQRDKTGWLHRSFLATPKPKK